MAKLNAQSKRRGPVSPTPEPPDDASAGGVDLRATVALTPEALSALLAQVKKSQSGDDPGASTETDDPDRG
jgi:hypothetical protein